jgi:hypothetical protein
MSKQQDLAPTVLKMRKSGMSWNAIAKELHVSSETVRMSIDEDYAERRRIANNARRKARYVPKRIHMVEQRPPAPDAHRAIELAASRAKRDTRTPFQRAFGDPPFERSALYQKMQGKP